MSGDYNSHLPDRDCADMLRAIKNSVSNSESFQIVTVTIYNSVYLFNINVRKLKNIREQNKQRSSLRFKREINFSYKYKKRLNIIELNH